MTTIKRFWLKVDKTKDCWEWTACKDRGGYGIFGYSKHKNVKAHRMSWSLAHGDIPEGLLVCHHCDNPSCVRPNHLFLGTLKDNAYDMIRKGRKVVLKGEELSFAKLTERQVRTIKELWSKKVCTRKQLEEIFNVAKTTVYTITTGTTWKHINI